MISFIPRTNASKGHNPSSSFGHPSIPVSGTAASLSISRTCLSVLALIPEDEHLRTWSWRLVPKGQNLRRVSK